MAVAPAAVAYLDEAELGKAGNYQYQRFGPAFSTMTEQYKVGTFSNMDSIFASNPVRTGSEFSRLEKGVMASDLRYVYQGQQFAIEDFLARQRITGLLILKDGHIAFERYQYDRTFEHKFASFSMAKTVVAILVGIAQRDGHIASLDDPAEKYAPELARSVWGPVTIRNLLRMSSGIKWNDTVAFGQANDIARLSVETYFRRARGGASAISWVTGRSYPQGVKFNYSSAETFALGLVLRGAVRADLASYLSEHVWKPIGAESDASWNTDWSDVEAAFCCINARLRDYGRLGLLLAYDGAWNGRQIVPRQYMMDMTDVARQPDHLKPRRAMSYFGYGYQTWLYPYKSRTFQARGLFGQELIVQPESKIVVVITSVSRSPNTTPEIFAERQAFVAAVLGALGGSAEVQP